MRSASPHGVPMTAWPLPVLALTIFGCAAGELPSGEAPRALEPPVPSDRATDTGTADPPGDTDRAPADTGEGSGATVGTAEPRGRPAVEASPPEAPPEPPAAPVELRFLVAFHIATAHPETAEARVRRILDIADRHFSAAGVGFHLSAREALPPEFITVETIPERHRLKRYLVKRRINVFVVDEILDPVPSKATRRAAKWQGRAPTGRLAGAHIEAKKRVPDTYILLSRESRDISLTHELGHFFGLPHRREADNIMSYGSKRTLFFADQLEVIRRSAKRLRRTRRVDACAPPCGEGAREDPPTP